MGEADFLGDRAALHAIGRCDEVVGARVGFFRVELVVILVRRDRGQYSWPEKILRPGRPTG